MVSSRFSHAHRDVLRVMAETLLTVPTLVWFGAALRRATTGLLPKTKQAPEHSELVYRGWPGDAEEIAEALSEADISADVVETLVPGSVGVGLVVCELFVKPADIGAAQRIARRISD